MGVKAGWHKGGRPTDPDEDDLAPDERIVQAVSEWVARRLPRVDPEPIRAETCVYTNVEGERFVCELRGRYVVGSACSGHGFKFAPAVGELLAGIAERPNGPDPSLGLGTCPDRRSVVSAKSGRKNSSNVSLSQLATVAGVSARTFAVRGTFIASATSPK